MILRNMSSITDPYGPSTVDGAYKGNQACKKMKSLNGGYFSSIIEQNETLPEGHAVNRKRAEKSTGKRSAVQH